MKNIRKILLFGKVFIIFFVFIVIVGCNNNTTKNEDKYIYITYKLDKEYTIGIDNDFISRDIKELDSRFLDIDIRQITQYIIDENKEYLDGKNVMTFYVDTDESSIYNQCIVQVLSFLNTNYPNYTVKLLNIESGGEGKNEHDTTNVISSNSNDKNTSGSSSNSIPSTSKNNTNNNVVDNRPAIVLPTINYICPSGEYKDGKCVTIITYSANVKQECPDGYEVKDNKTCVKIVKKPANVDTHCKAGELINNHCIQIVKGDTINAYNIGWYYDGCPEGKQCIEDVYYEDTYGTAPDIVCPEGTTTQIAGWKKLASCYSDGYTYEPLSVSCPNSETLTKEGNEYFCIGSKKMTRYTYYYCASEEWHLEGTKCVNYITTEYDLLYNHYCEMGEQLVMNNQEYECVSSSEAKLIVSYYCQDGGEYNDDDGTCVKKDFAVPEISYSCLDGYTLTSDYVCAK